MYLLKNNMKIKIKEITNRQIADKVGVTETYMSQIVNQKRKASKTLAYAISKAISNDYEIEDVFKES